MKDYPNSFWALTFITLAFALAIAALFAPTKDNITLAVIAISSNIVSGSFGYISGHAAGAASISGQNTTITNPTAPADPAKK